MTEIFGSFNTELVPPIRSSFLIALEPSHLGKRFRTKVAGIVRRPGHLRCAKIGESLHLLRLLSLHLQTLLEHLMMVYQLMSELLELPEHLSHLLGRHIVRTTK